MDGKANVIESYLYDAFGNLLERTSGAGSTAVTCSSAHFPNDILYAGEQYDSVPETYYLWARNYNPAEGRFLNEDRYHGDGRNLYVYVGSNPLRYTDPSGYCKKSAGEYLHELFGKIKEDEDLIPYYFITYSYGDSGLPCIGSAVGISYSTYNFPFIKTALAVRDDINDDIVDVVIEVAGDYLPSETLENAAIFFSNVSDMYEKMVTPLKKCADFFEWLTALSVPAIGETLTFGAPSLITPEGWVVEGGVAVSGTVVVLVEASGAAVFEAAAYGSQRNADKSNEISQKLRNKAEATKHGEQRLAERGFSQEKNR